MKESMHLLMIVSEGPCINLLESTIVRTRSHSLDSLATLSTNNSLLVVDITIPLDVGPVRISIH
jgi:hypothetical protein